MHSRKVDKFRKVVELRKIRTLRTETHDYNSMFVFTHVPCEIVARQNIYILARSS
jgi:hypothetical protein